jgi:O-antigen/teichoic acid export membrane protein
VSDVPPSTPAAAGASRGAGQIRGSSLLLLGRIVALGINFGVQVLIVRYLSKADYGAFAYALSIALFMQTIVTLGLDRAVTRFIPIYDEEGRYDRLLGTLLFVGAVVVGLGVVTIAGTFLVVGPLGAAPVRDGDAKTLLLILVVMAPLEALNELFVGLFAVFSRPRAIFFRRYLLTSGLRLAVSVLLVVTNSGVALLATGYVLTGAVGVAISAIILLRILRDDGYLDHFRRVRPEVPAREILSFTMPLLTTDLVYAVMVASDAILLGHFKGAEAVATLRAVQPVAQMNQLVFSSFLFMFTPSIARLYARGDRRGIDDVYWHTAGWIAVLSSPVFLVTFSVAGPVTSMLFGARYADSAALLAVLAVGYYVQAALGFNGTTLMVFGEVRTLVALNVVAVAVNIGANLVAIPRFGALGAAVATAATLIVHNILKQAALSRVARVRFFPREYGRAYGSVVAAAVLLGVAASLVTNDAVALALAVLTGAVVLAVNRGVLLVGDTFPEVMRIPVLRRIFAS